MPSARTAFSGRGRVTLPRPLTLRPLPRTCLSIRKSRGFATNSVIRYICAQRLWWLLRIPPNGEFARRDLVVAADSAERGVCAQGRGRSPARLRAPTHPFDISRAKARTLLEPLLMVRRGSSRSEQVRLRKATYIYEHHITPYLSQTSLNPTALRSHSYECSALRHLP